MGLMYMFDINGKKQTSSYVFVLKGQKQIMMDIIRKQMWVLMMGSTNKYINEFPPCVRPASDLFLFEKLLSLCTPHLIHFFIPRVH